MKNLHDNRRDVLKTGYQEVCQRYKGIDDFRLKLLGLLPLTTSGIFLLLKLNLPSASAQEELNSPLSFPLPVPFYEESLDIGQWLSGSVTGPIGLFGFVATLGLFFYELRGMQYCIALIRAGQDIEKELGVEGCFSRRPPRVAGFLGVRAAAGVIYPGVLAAWAYMASFSPWAAVVTFFGLMVVYFSLDLEGYRALDCPECRDRQKHLWARDDAKLEKEVQNHLKEHHSSEQRFGEEAIKRKSKTIVRQRADHEYHTLRLPRWVCLLWCGLKRRQKTS
jgi:hypothetical protein